MSIFLIGLVKNQLSSKQIAALKALAPNMEFVYTNDKEEIAKVIADVEIVAGYIPRDLTTKATSLRWYQQWGAGADWLAKHPEVAAMDFTLTSASGVHAVPISEHIFAFLLGHARLFRPALEAQMRGEWASNEAEIKQHSVELAHSTMLLIGVGAIGERTAKIAAAHEMEVIGLRRDPSIGCPHIERMVSSTELLTVLPEADFVVITAPLTAETKHMFNADAFAAMKSSAYIVNIGRGGIIDEQALVSALQNGSISGAGLDVFEQEPLPADSPLWSMQNVMITAHYSGLTPNYDSRAFEILLDNLRRYQSNQPLRNVVDKELGY